MQQLDLEYMIFFKTSTTRRIYVFLKLASSSQRSAVGYTTKYKRYVASLGFSMVHVYWPKVLLGNSEIDVELCVIAYQKEGADLVVLSLVTEEQYKREVNEPFVKIGIIDRHGEFQFELHMKNGAKVKVIEFVPPKLTLMQFFSLEPISLTLPEKLQVDSFEDHLESPSNYLKLMNYSKLKADNQLRASLDIINMYYKHLETFNCLYPEYAERKLDFTKVWTNAKKWARLTFGYRIFCHLLLYSVVVIRLSAGGLSALLNWDKLPLISISATMQQIDLRAQQICYIPVQYMRINGGVSLQTADPRLTQTEKRNVISSGKPNDRRKSFSFQSLPCEYYPDYIRLYNTLWLIANDVSLGVTLGALLLEKRIPLSQALHFGLHVALFEYPIRITKFLVENPFGIKLNAELSKFLSELFIWIMQFAYTLFIAPLSLTSTLDKFILFVAHISTLFGATLALAIFVDCISLLSLHISLFYLISARLYRWQITVMAALFYLFWGKKINVLRNRIDNHTFNLDQMLMGTLIFIVLIFLFPTVLAFYLTYTIMKLLFVAISTVLKSLMALLNHFPLFALLLRLKDPRRLPGGISIKLKGFNYVLENNPLKVSMMFQPYADSMSIVAQKFMSLKTIHDVILGQPIMVHQVSLYHVLYSSLPLKPVDTNLIWKELEQLMT
ncbi:phosphatidylinositol N-acetylglucosaminyltransferase Ecym_2086 [Eremothecium cymbalariae DBVPG|uniref:Phosphatidylinositol N-acetylglucosaminyltransferase subunit GPI1 n=1 Tax=Eremothecium cymbalariae (strain CBS 270.75 / DBVPG 7215 / KCTC 17166 / NRRL Y-17582) TaxID=931890 RepID=G8JPJ0_ERECY|nr:Hypothetical protein Ecym_2086 [Eremothecium cymbalariae DBVPG\